jgi:hypothetical protein
MLSIFTLVSLPFYLNIINIPFRRERELVPYGNASKALSLGFLFKQIYLGMKKVIDL